MWVLQLHNVQKLIILFICRPGGWDSVPVDGHFLNYCDYIRLNGLLDWLVYTVSVCPCLGPGGHRNTIVPQSINGDQEDVVGSTKIWGR